MIKRNSPRSAQRGKHGFRTYFLIFVCGLLTVSGFFLAGRQHFSWMDYGMRNSRLRKQIDELQAEKRRLLLARETSLAPDEIKKAAKKFITTTLAGATSSTAPVASTIAAVVKPNAPNATKPIVEKTVAVSPAASPIAATLKKVDKPTKPQTKTTTAAE